MPSPRPISGPDPRLPSISCQNISEMPAKPEQRAERDARPQRLAEEERGESDVGERGEREDDRKQARHDVVAGIVEEDEVGRVEQERRAPRSEGACEEETRPARRRCLQTRNISGAAIRNRQTIDTCGSTTPSWNFSASHVVLHISTVPAKRPRSPVTRAGPSPLPCAGRGCETDVSVIVRMLERTEISVDAPASAAHPVNPFEPIDDCG